MNAQRETLMPIEEWRNARFTTPPCNRTVRKWCARGEIPARRIGKQWYIIVEQEMQATGNQAADALVNEVLKAS